MIDVADFLENNILDESLEKKTNLRYINTENLKSPLFTVFIPTYCRRDLLKEALDSVFAQWRVPFIWEILVIDNEEYNGEENDTEELIKQYKSTRIRYYRNKEHLSPADNFNLGFMLAKGKWVMMLHDDDILMNNSLHNMYNTISALEGIGKRVGAIDTPGYKFINSPGNHEQKNKEVHDFFLIQPTIHYYHKWELIDILFKGELSGDISSCGATYNREAVLSVGGFNANCTDNFGLMANKILYCTLANKNYEVYSTTVPFGFQRQWGRGDPNFKPERLHKNIKFWFDFREYIFLRKSWYKIWRFLFRKVQHRRFCVETLFNRKIWTGNMEVNLNLFDDICSVHPSRIMYNFYVIVLKKAYEKYKKIKMNRLNRKIVNRFGDKIKYKEIL